MAKIVKDTIKAKGIDIGIYTEDFQNEFISLTDIAKYKSDNPTAVIQNWMRGRDVIEFLGLWETLHNSDFKPIECEGFKTKPVQTHLPCHQKNGLRVQMLLVLYQSQGDMAEHMHIPILLLSLHHGFLRNSNYIS